MVDVSKIVPPKQVAVEHVFLCIDCIKAPMEHYKPWGWPMGEFPMETPSGDSFISTGACTPLNKIFRIIGSEPPVAVECVFPCIPCMEAAVSFAGVCRHKVARCSAKCISCAIKFGHMFKNGNKKHKEFGSPGVDIVKRALGDLQIAAIYPIHPFKGPYGPWGPPV